MEGTFLILYLEVALPPRAREEYSFFLSSWESAYFTSHQWAWRPPPLLYMEKLGHQTAMDQKHSQWPPEDKASEAGGVLFKLRWQVSLVLLYSNCSLNKLARR